MDFQKTEVKRAIQQLTVFFRKFSAYHNTSLLSSLKTSCTAVSFKALAHIDMHNLNHRLKSASLLSRFQCFIWVCQIKLLKGNREDFFKSEVFGGEKTQPWRLVFISNRSVMYQNLLFPRVTYPDKTFLIYNKSTFSTKNITRGKKQNKTTS